MSASDIVLPAALRPLSTAAGFAVPDFALPDPLGRIGDLELRLASKPKDIRKAQKLRYKVFFEEMSAVPNVMARLARRDVDIFDTVCDHLLVRDGSPRPGILKKRTVGTYRLLRQEVAEKNF